MKRIIFVLIITGLYAFSYAGKVKEIQGKVDLLIDGKWQPAAVDMDINDNTKIMTGIGSSMKVETKGGFFIVNELSMVTFREQTTETSSDQKISVDIGKVRVHFTKIEGIKSSFKIQSPKGTASVRGTYEDYSFGPGHGMKINVIEGSIDVTQVNGQTITTVQGEKTEVTAKGDFLNQSKQVQQNVGYTSQFTDNDTQSAAVQQIIEHFVNPAPPAPPEQPQPVKEPERL